MVVSPKSVAAFPAANPLMLNHMLFNLEIAGMADSSLSAPYHLSIGDASGDVTYSLDRGGAAMQGTGTFDGKPFTETWTFGQKGIAITGKIGDADEKLTLDLSQQDTWHLQGTVGDVPVDETVLTKSAADADHLTASGTIQEKVDVRHAATDGTYAATEAGDPLNGKAAFTTLKDRITIDASGTSGDLPWHIAGAGIFGPSGNSGDGS